MLNDKVRVDPGQSPAAWLPLRSCQQRTPFRSDFSARIVDLPQQAIWQPTAIANLEIRLLEWVPGETDRISALLRLSANTRQCRLPNNNGLETLILQGEIEHGTHSYPAGSYLRNPQQVDANIPVNLHRRKSVAQLYVAAGQMGSTDTENRTIDTQDESRWLPGPVSGTEVLALHGHGTANAMLVRWHDSAEFQPNLDPLGEEVLVLAGILGDSEGQYPTGSWIRNPVPAWQTWCGNEGTVMYYKTGHFTGDGQT